MPRTPPATARAICSSLAVAASKTTLVCEAIRRDRRQHVEAAQPWHGNVEDGYIRRPFANCLQGPRAVAANGDYVHIGIKPQIRRQRHGERRDGHSPPQL